MSDKSIENQREGATDEVDSCSLRSKVIHYALIVASFILFVLLVFSVYAIIFIGVPSNKVSSDETQLNMENYIPVLSSGKIEVIEEIKANTSWGQSKIKVKDLEDGLETVIKPSSIYGSNKGNINWSLGDIKVVDRVHYLDKSDGNEKLRSYTLAGKGEFLLKEYGKSANK